MSVVEQSDTRFTIDNSGWARMNAGRSAPHLIREAVSNSLDAPGVTEIKVRLEPGFVSIEDDSDIESIDPKLLFTVFMTNKEDDPCQKGRKGRGLKELISAAEWAEVDTVGHRITFTEGRLVEVSDRKRGTKVTVKVQAWTQKDIDEAVAYLDKIIPPEGVKLYINDVLVKPRRVRTTIRNVNLRTQVIIDGVQRDTYRDTNVEIVNLAKGETRGWVYEMGIPVQQITTRFHINVCQRVPLNDNRDTVDSWYLISLYGIVLNAILPSMSAGACKHEWTADALYNLTEANERLFVKKLYGDLTNLAITTGDSQVNDVAKQNDYTLINTSGMPGTMETLFKRVLPTASTVVKTIESHKINTPVLEADVDPTGRVRNLVRFLGHKLISRDVGVEYFHGKAGVLEKITIAHFDTVNRVIGFNTNKDAGNRFDDPLNQRLLSTIVHELAHDTTSLHDEEFTNEVQRLAGALGVVILNHIDEIQAIVNDSKHTIISCRRCGADRRIRTQDVPQIKHCVECTKIERRERAKARRTFGV
jgi:hypothetical protein